MVARQLTGTTTTSHHHLGSCITARGLFKSWGPHFKGNDGFFNISWWLMPDGVLVSMSLLFCASVCIPPERERIREKEKKRKIFDLEKSQTRRGWSYLLFSVAPPSIFSNLNGRSSNCQMNRCDCKRSAFLYTPRCVHKLRSRCHIRASLCRRISFLFSFFLFFKMTTAHAGLYNFLDANRIKDNQTNSQRRVERRKEVAFFLCGSKWRDVKVGVRI